ncbi:Homeobox protein knotted-1-like 10 [Camellia lanceoleosa]|uniref:Homeobox protein knotted-1-like 10 n=1 Tax=Camellia lanceoleosa TaxID=1840588 RepID=A0ACC0HFS1_9ERIC|nr:Homeobox protein knotted-1-like 10 [Camellia lanceoleosa]
MDELYRLHSSILFSDHDHDVSGVGDFPTTLSGLHGPVDNMLQFEATEIEVGGSELSDLIKAQIANHPLYRNLVSAYIECRKVVVVVVVVDTSIVHVLLSNFRFAFLQ